MDFHDVYKVKQGDNLTKIARARGFLNPGPIVFYPPNQPFFSKRNPNQLRPGDVFVIPWAKEKLTKFIEGMKTLREDVQKTSQKLLKEEVENREELENFLFEIDAINFIAQLHVAIGSLAVEYSATLGEEAKILAEAGPKAAEKVAELWAEAGKESVAWTVDTGAHVAFGDIAPMLAEPKPPQEGAAFLARHAFGPWTPSYWASVYTAIKTQDMGVWLYGSEWTTYKNAQKIAQTAKEEVIKIEAPLNHAQLQLQMSFYGRRI